jgi:TPR repeat protein
VKPLDFVLGLFGFLVLTVATASADHSHGFQKASDAYSAGDYATAVHLWGEEAKRGEVEAQEMLGAMYAAGKGVKQDYAEALKWYRVAAEAGRVSAQYAL